MNEQKAKRMIDAALKQDANLVPRLQEMAERFNDAFDALAAFLVGERDEDYYDYDRPEPSCLGED